MAVSIVIVFSPRRREVIEWALSVEQGSTVSSLLQNSNLLAQFPGWEMTAVGLGVWGRKVPLTYILRDLDRLEVYRPLTVDPKVARRERFVGQGAKRAAGLFAKRRTGAKAGY